MAWFLALAGLPNLGNGSRYTNGIANEQTPVDVRVPILGIYDYVMRAQNGRPQPQIASTAVQFGDLHYSPATRLFYIPLTSVNTAPNNYPAYGSWAATTNLGDYRPAYVTFNQSVQRMSGWTREVCYQYVDQSMLFDLNGDQIPPKVHKDLHVVNPACIMWYFGKEKPPVTIPAPTSWTMEFELGSCPFSVQYYFQENKRSGQCYWSVVHPAAPSLAMTRTWGKVGSNRKPATSTKRNCSAVGRTIRTMLNDKLIKKHYAPTSLDGKAYGVVNTQGMKISNMTRLLTTIPAGRSLVRLVGEN